MKSQRKKRSPGPGEGVPEEKALRADGRDVPSDGRENPPKPGRRDPAPQPGRENLPPRPQRPSPRLFRFGVRDFLAFTRREGDLETGFFEPGRLAEGAEAHRFLQKNASEGYAAEVPVSDRAERDGVTLVLSGRADGIYEEDGLAVVDEIKSLGGDLDAVGEDYDAMHWEQAKTYAWLFAKAHGLERMGVRLTYFGYRDRRLKRFRRTYAAEALEKEHEDRVDYLLGWLVRYRDWLDTRDASLRGLPFPFPAPREGQKGLMEAASEALAEGARLFAQAPTGTGKTLGSLYPAVLFLGGAPKGAEGAEDAPEKAARAGAGKAARARQILYLTAKTSTRLVAEEAGEALAVQGARLRRLTFTAKEKVCVEPQGACGEGRCPRGPGHFGRLPEALREGFAAERLDRETLLGLADRHRLCPHALALALKPFCDIVIADYNHAFEPRSRFKEGLAGSVLIVDEAHNLLERARAMFSAEVKGRRLLRLLPAAEREGFGDLLRQILLLLYEACGLEAPPVLSLAPPAAGLAPPSGPASEAPPGSDFMPPDFDCDPLAEARYAPLDDSELEDSSSTRLLPELPPDLLTGLAALRKALEERLRAGGGEAAARKGADRKPLLDLYFELTRFLTVYEAMRKEAGLREAYALYGLGQEGRGGRGAPQAVPELHLFCLDPAPLLDAALKEPEAGLFLSATLTPLPYFVHCLGGGTAARIADLPSPFPPRNFKVLFCPHAPTLARQRAEGLDFVVECLTAMATARTGNYLFFFPSYAYLDQVLKRFTRRNPRIRWMAQRSGMSEAERKLYLQRFNRHGEESLAAFAVLGGIFGEGVDLPGEKLSGAAIVGFGLPPPSRERELIRAHFDDAEGQGERYAYLFPALNKVAQAGGRVIRTENDKGVLLLLDPRFAEEAYQRHLPLLWKPFTEVQGPEDLREELARFWTSCG